MVTPWQKYTGVLAHRNFTKLWIAQVCAKLSEHFLNFSLIILLFQITKSTFLVSFLVALVSIPPILFSAGAGVVADSFNRKLIMQLSNGLRLTLVVALLFTWREPLVILLGAFILSVLAQFFSPAEVASIPTLVPREQIFAANSFYQFTGYASFLIGYSLAGPALLRLGAEGTFGISLILYALAVIFVSLLPKLTQHLKTLSELETAISRRYATFWTRFKDGIRFIKQHPVILFLIIQLGVVFSIEKSFISLAPSFSQNFLKFNVEEISLFLILPTGLGAFIGAIVANLVKKRFRKDRLINFGLLLDGAALLLIAFVSQIVNVGPALGLSVDSALKIFIVAMSFLSGFADPFIIVSAQTAIHELVPNEDRGRVFGALYTIINTMAIIPVLIIGSLVSGGVAITTIVIGLAVAILVAAGIGISYYQRHHLG